MKISKEYVVLCWTDFGLMLDPALRTSRFVGSIAISDITEAPFQYWFVAYDQLYLSRNMACRCFDPLFDCWYIVIVYPLVSCYCFPCIP